MEKKIKKLNSIKDKNIIRVLKGSIIAILISMVLLILFAIILANTDVSESIMPYAIIIICAISILIGSIISSIKIQKKGIINGALVGTIYIVVLYIFSSIIENNFSLNSYSIIMCMFAILFGCIGGVIGVNVP